MNNSKFPASERFANAIVNTLDEAEGKVYVKNWVADLNYTRREVNIFTSM